MFMRIYVGKYSWNPELEAESRQNKKIEMEDLYFNVWQNVYY